jgi:hypothetical protein
MHRNSTQSNSRDGDDLLRRISYSFGDRTNDRADNCVRSMEGAQVLIS